MPRLGDLLVESKLVTDEQRHRAVTRQGRLKGRIGTALLEEEVSEDVVAHGLSVQTGVPTASPESLESIRPDVLRLVPGRVAQRLHAVPFRREGRVVSVAMRDPGDLPALDELAALTGLRIAPYAALDVRIYALLYRYYAADVEPRYLTAAAFLREGVSPPKKDSEDPTQPKLPRPKTLPGPRPVPPPPPEVLSPYPQRIRPMDAGDPWQVEGATVAASAALRRRAEPEIFDDPLEVSGPQPESMEFPKRPEAGPEASAEQRLLERLSGARHRDDVAEAVLEDALRHVRRAALFIAHGDHVTGWAATPAPREGFSRFRLPDTEPSVFATLRNTEGFYVGPQPDLPGTAATLEALGSDGLGLVAVLPVNLKGKTVVFLYGEAPEGSRPPSVPALRRLAALAATGLEIVLLKGRLTRL
ncbi:MAG: hypothetical protein WCC53_17335 [Thermoanaerobaculia bacterium]|jgi:hypothetical protein